MKRLFLALIWGFSGALFLWANDPVLKIAYAEGNAPPYAFVKGGRLTGGLIRDIGNWLGRKLGVKVTYVFTSRLRTDDDLKTGRIDVLPISNPAWLPADDGARWSRRLFWENDVFVENTKFPCPVKSLNDLKGKRIGTLLGYVYPAKLEKLFSSGQATRQDVVRLEQNLRKLENGRIDLAYDSNVLIEYAIRDHFQNLAILPYRLTPPWPIQMALGPHAPVSFRDFNASVDALVESGALAQMLAAYGIAGAR
jgi:ABC-type amino acid transport substrate-binding protein